MLKFARLVLAPQKAQGGADCRGGGQGAGGGCGLEGPP